jgi:prepilin-type N-terminal cleavage/methylation domain-containing protein
MRSGFSLIELVVVMVLSGLIALLHLPMMLQIHSHYDRTVYCGNHLRQVALVMCAYANDEDQQWPVLPCTRTGLVNRDPALIDARATAMATFEFIAEYSGGDLTPKLFRCHSGGMTVSLKPAALQMDHPQGSPISSPWAALPPLDQPQMAYDWTAPKTAQSNRVVLACRPTTANTTHHKKKVSAVYADGHAGTLTLGSPGAGRRTTACDGSAFTLTALNKDAANDDIFGDDGTPAAAGAGSPTLAWVR